MTNRIIKVLQKKLKEFNTMLPLQLQLPSKEHLKVSFTENYVLKFRCWFRKLCNFHKLKTSGLPEYLFDLIPQNNHLYNNRFWKMLGHFTVELILSYTPFFHLQY